MTETIPFLWFLRTITAVLIFKLGTVVFFRILFSRAVGI